MMRGVVNREGGMRLLRVVQRWKAYWRLCTNAGVEGFYPQVAFQYPRGTKTWIHPDKIGVRPEVA